MLSQRIIKVVKTIEKEPHKARQESMCMYGIEDFSVEEIAELHDLIGRYHFRVAMQRSALLNALNIGEHKHV